MIVSIGGSSSTGSSLLVQLLSRHKQIISGPESSLLARPQVYFQWKKHKHKVTKDSFSFLRNYSWHRDNSIDIPYEVWRITQSEVQGLIHQTHSFSDFLISMGELINSRNKTKVWVDKTPANSILFSSLLTDLNECYCILTIRNPYEAIASMVNRGYEPVYASCIYLMNSAYGLLDGDPPSWMCVKYEDLVIDYQQVCLEVAGFLKLENQYDWDIQLPKVKMEGWQHAETELPFGEMELRFPKLPESVRLLINYCIYNLRIKEEYNIYGLYPTYTNIAEISMKMDYKLEPLRSDCYSVVINRLTKEKIIRTIKLHPTHVFNFPIEINRK